MTHPLLRLVGAAMLCIAGAAQGAASGPQLQGLWCGTGLLHEFRLRLAQDDAQVRGTLERKHKVRTIFGRLEGTLLHTQAVRHGSLVLRYAGDQLRIVAGEGPLALAQGQAFRRAPGGICA